MPTLSFSSDGPLVANVHIPGPTVREVAVIERGDGQVEVALAASISGSVSSARSMYSTLS